MERNGGTVGQSIVIKGELRAKEDLIIEGQVEGTIQLDQGVLTIGPNGRVGAQVQAKVVNVMGKVKGSITGTETISIGKTYCGRRPGGTPCWHRGRRLLPRPNRHAAYSDPRGPGGG